MKFVIKLVLACFLFFLLIGRNLPYENLYISGLGPWDLFAICLFPFLDYKIIPKKKLKYLFIFFVSAIIGLLLNAHIAARTNDLFEILRVIYSIELIALGFLFGKYLENNIIIYIIFFSSLTIFTFAYLNPMNSDVLGFVQIWNPNVIGNYLGHCVVLILVLSEKLNYEKIILCTLLLFFSFFTYSKASWIIIFLISITIFIKVSNSKKFILLILLALFIKYNIDVLIDVQTLINTKILHSNFEGSAASGSSVGARIGLAYSGLLMFLENPIFGVGIGNFEIANDTLKSTLGNMYYKDDNANSLFFHYLGTTGIFGFSAVILLIWEYFKLLKSSSKSKTIYFLIIIFIGVSINFQRELFTTNTMYLLIGILIYKNYIENNYFKSIY